MTRKYALDMESSLAIIHFLPIFSLPCLLWSNEHQNIGGFRSQAHYDTYETNKKVMQCVTHCMTFTTVNLAGF